MCNQWICTKQPSNQLKVCFSLCCRLASDQDSPSYQRTQGAVRLLTISMIYSVCWFYSCTLKWKQSQISILLPWRTQPIRYKYKHIFLNAPSRNRWNLSRLPLLHSFLDTSAHILFWRRSSCWRVVKQSNQLSAPLWPEGPGTGVALRAPSATKR